MIYHAGAILCTCVQGVSWIFSQCGFGNFVDMDLIKWTSLGSQTCIYTWKRAYIRPLACMGTQCWALYRNAREIEPLLTRRLSKYYYYDYSSKPPTSINELLLTFYGIQSIYFKSWVAKLSIAHNILQC